MEPHQAAIGQISSALLLVGVLGSGCTGSIEDAGSGASGGFEPTGPTRGASNERATDGSSNEDAGGTDERDTEEGRRCDGEPSTSARPLRRLTATQYDNTVRDLLGSAHRPAADFPPDETTEGFEIGSLVSPLLAEGYIDAAETLAEEATQDLGGLLPCDPATMGEDACAFEFIERFGRRAFRRALTAAEIERFESLYVNGRERYDFRTGIQMVVQAALQSPSFLYHVEPWPEGAEAGSVVRVKGYAMANRLSYALWNSMPDDRLLEAAADNELDDPAGVATQARRLLDGPRAQEGFRDFYRQWLHLDRLEGLTKDAERFPRFDELLAEDMREAVEAFVDDVMWGGDATLHTLLTADFVYASEKLADIYGVDVGDVSQLQRIDVPAGQRAGLLTQPGMMAMLAKPNQTDPVHRGKFVREQLLCQKLPAPPNDILIVPPDPDPALTTRERFAEHSEDAACAGCHKLMDPIGFGFEAYDPIGRYRETDEGRPVDTSGEVVAAGDADGPFTGAVELSERLASSDVVRECVAKQVLRYVLARVETRADVCSVDALLERFTASGYDLRELWVAATQTDAFLYGVVPAVEGGSP